MVDVITIALEDTIEMNHTLRHIPKETWTSPKVEIRESGAHGKGSVAMVAIGRAEVVEVWGENWNGQQTVQYTSDVDKANEARHAGKSVMQWDLEALQH